MSNNSDIPAGNSANDSASEAHHDFAVSESATRGDVHALDALRRQAKQLLKQAHAGDPVLLERLRALLPRMAKLNDASIIADIKLADIQHAIARKAGKESWSELKASLESQDPIHLQAARFLEVLREHQLDRAKAMLDANPAIGRYNISTAAATGNADLVAAFIAGDATSATRAASPRDAEPILYAAHAALPSLLGVTVSDRVRTVQLLLDAGASANAFVQISDDPNARIPALYFACVSNNVEVARLLLDRGAKVNDGESVYHAAEHNHRECLQLLKERGANLSGPHEFWGNTPLYFLAAYNENNESFATAVLGMQWLLENGADPNVPSNPNPTDTIPGQTMQPDRGERPLHRLVAPGRPVSTVEMFLAHGADVNATREDGRTPYNIAVRTGNTAAMQVLEAHGAITSNLNAVDRLLGACAVGDEATARELVARHPHMIASLDVSDRRALHTNIFNNREDGVRLMLSLGWPTTDESEWGGTPLHWAAWNGRAPLVRALLDSGAAVNVRDSAYGSSPIAWAAHGSTNARPHHDDDYVAITRMLLDAGATRAESYNKWNESPERMASAPVAELLRSSGFVR